MTNEITKDTWNAFVNDFSKRNLGRPTSLEIFGELGAQEEEKFLPLNGLTLDQVGGDAPRVAIMLGNAADKPHLTHTVASVTQILPKQDDAGVDEALEIVSASGEKTLLRFVPQPGSNQ